MKKLKIGLVLDDTLDSNDGVQQYVRTLGEYFAAQGHDVHYLVGHTQRQDIANVHSLSRNLKVRFNQNRMSMPLPAARAAIRRLLQAEKFDVLHVQLPHSPFLAGRIVKAAPRGTAVVGTFHIAPHSRLVHLGNQLLRVLVRGSLKRFDAMMSVSPVAQAFAKKTFGLESVVVPNTLLLERFWHATPLPNLKKSLNIVFLGRLVKRKGCQYLLQAVAQLRQNDFPTMPTVIICGGGPLEKILKTYVARHNLTDVVTFAGRLSEADKPRYLAAADIAVYPSTGGESFGIVLLEAMAAARGVVLAGDNPGYAALLTAHPAALIEPQNTHAFAASLADYLENPTKRRTAHTWQQQFVQEFDVPVVAAKVLAVYAQAIAKRAVNSNNKNHVWLF